jgi:hypothetical protein
LIVELWGHRTRDANFLFEVCFFNWGHNNPEFDELNIFFEQAAKILVAEFLGHELDGIRGFPHIVSFECGTS